MGRSQFAGQVEPLVMEIYRNDRITADEGGSEDRRQADRAKTEHCDTGSWCWTKSIENSSGSCLNTTAQRRQHGQGKVAGDFDNIASPRERITGK
ncbi:hypothetical protein ACFB49_25860 [Sphingomonas sp. DBB INV C78]